MRVVPRLAVVLVFVSVSSVVGTGPANAAQQERGRSS